MGTSVLQYDNPTYITVQNQNISIAAGSGTSARFTVFSDCIAKSLILKPAVVSTTADTVTAYAVTNVTTKTLGVTTIASAQSTFSRLEFTTASRTLTQGDEIRITKGTDATVVYAGSVELVITPGAAVTA